MRSQAHILEEDWAEDYAISPTFSKVWRAVHSNDADWPQDYKVFRGKLYCRERLCVPENLVPQIVKEHHDWVGHVGNDRLEADLLRRYGFPLEVEIKPLVQEVRKNCLVCQACDRPNWSMRRPVSGTPIPDRVMVSVCLDIFSMPPAEWLGQTYDAFLMCVDRLSGWMVARPTQKQGLTGEKSAHLLLDGGWGEVGIPSVVTSDQGPQFVSQWWVTMCSRLGIRMAYAQAHRPQANGRAEVAGRVVQDVLRKLLIDRNINWVEALPHALRIHHDMAEPTTGLSPYQIMFGRERTLAGLPWDPPRECQEASDFFAEMKHIDEEVARFMSEAHEKWANRINAHRKAGTPPAVGDWVWYLRPREVGGNKLQSWWLGPYKVVERVGERSYQVRTPRGEVLDVHLDQIKPCHWEMPESSGIPLQYPPCEGEEMGEGESDGE